MARFILKRFLTALFIVLFVVLLNYTIIHLAPGDPVLIMAGFDNPSQEQIDALTVKYGLDQPVPVQFVKYVGNMLKGDLGVSYNISKNTPIAQMIQTRLPISICIGGLAVTIGAIV